MGGHAQFEFGEDAPTIYERRDLKKRGMSSRAIDAALKDGRLVKGGRGLYVNPYGDLTLHHTYAKLALRVPEGILCLRTALVFHGLTTHCNHWMEMALPPGVKLPKIDFIEVKAIRLRGRALTDGIETHRVEGIDVRVYSVAKTLADVFHFREQLSPGIELEAIFDNWLNKLASVDEILSYGRIWGVEDEMRPFLEDEYIQTIPSRI